MQSRRFPAEYRAGARDAAQTARLVGRAHVLWGTTDGEPAGPAWARIERQMLQLLRRAATHADRAYAAAYTGTHP